MKSIAILPARMGASRFPGKPMHLINGVPLIGHCYYRTKLAQRLDEIYVATCDQEIAEYIESIGGKAVMTSTAHNRATDRTGEAMLKIEAATGEKVDVVVMVQGDEPLTHPDMIDDILVHFDDPENEIVNLMSRLTNRTEFEDKNNVKVVSDQSHNALYFSREPVPSPWKGIDGVPMFMQVGIIAFRRESLFRFNELGETPLEQIESVDMNRVLETGGKIKMVPTDNVMVGVDTFDEAERVAALLSNDPLVRRYSQT